MRSISLLILSLVLMALSNCSGKHHCEDAIPVCVHLKTYTLDDKSMICISVKNNMSQDIYLTGFKTLGFGLVAKRLYKGLLDDRTFGFLIGPDRDNEPRGYTGMRRKQDTKMLEKSRHCKQYNMGPLQRISFIDSVINELSVHIDSGFLKNAVDEHIAIETLIDQHFHLIFLPANAEISASVPVNEHAVIFDELHIQFVYPNLDKPEPNRKNS